MFVFLSGYESKMGLYLNSFVFLFLWTINFVCFIHEATILSSILVCVLFSLWIINWEQELTQSKMLCVLLVPQINWVNEWTISQCVKIIFIYGYRTTVYQGLYQKLSFRNKTLRNEPGLVLSTCLNGLYFHLLYAGYWSWYLLFAIILQCLHPVKLSPPLQLPYKGHFWIPTPTALWPFLSIVSAGDLSI